MIVKSYNAQPVYCLSTALGIIPANDATDHTFQIWSGVPTLYSLEVKFDSEQSGDVTVSVYVLVTVVTP